MALDLRQIRAEIIGWQRRQGCDCDLKVTVEPIERGGATVRVFHDPLCFLSLELERAALPLIPPGPEEAS